MAPASNKITEFPGSGDAQEHVSSLPADFLTQGRDPTREIRNLIDELQAKARESRRHQRQAEEERDELRGRLLDLQEKLDSESHQNGKFKALVRERDKLLAEQSQSGPVIADLKQRLKRHESDAAQTLKERDAAVETATQARRHLSSAQKAAADAQKTLAEARQELAASRKKGDTEPSAQLASLRQARDGMAEQITQLKLRINTLEDELADATYAREAAERAVRDNHANGTQASAAAVQNGIDAITLERDSHTGQLAAERTAFEASLSEQAAEIERLTLALATNGGGGSERHEMETHFEKRRLDMIELNTKLENAYREIRNLSASLAEARLHAKLAGKSGPAGGSASASKDDIAAMRRSFQAFSRDQKQIGLLAELETHTHTIADRAMHAGHAILHRVGTAFANLLGDLMEVPDQITQSTLRTLNQGIDFIALLLSDPEIEKSVRLSEARAFVVDDDENTGAMMVDALNLAGIHAIHTLSSSAAIAELASTPYDLILLDVHMPDLDGFELSAQIRNMAPHAETPIFFVTGDTSLENRVKSSLRGANEFIAKPFSVQELALKSLKSVITGQLRNR